MEPRPKGTFHGVRVDADDQLDPDIDGRPVLVGEPIITITRKQPGCWAFDTFLGYRAVSGDEFVVPSDRETFYSDLMSMPWPFAWLVPGTGKHIPGVLLHDGLVVPQNPDGTHGQHTHLGPRVTREEADRVLREAMYSEGTTLLRRWLMWAGVMLGTMWATFTPRWWWRTALVVHLLAIAVLGLAATLDIADTAARLEIAGVEVHQLWNLPWMGDRPWHRELLGGAAVAVLFPFVGSLLLLRSYEAPDPGGPRANLAPVRRRDRYLVGVIAGLWFAVLLHVTLLVVVVYAGYRTIDRLIARWAARARGEPPPVDDVADGPTPFS